MTLPFGQTHTSSSVLHSSPRASPGLSRISLCVGGEGRPPASSGKVAPPQGGPSPCQQLTQTASVIAFLLRPQSAKTAGQGTVTGNGTHKCQARPADNGEAWSLSPFSFLKAPPQVKGSHGFPATPHLSLCLSVYLSD